MEDKMVTLTEQIQLLRSSPLDDGETQEQREATIKHLEQEKDTEGCIFFLSQQEGD